MLISDIEKTFEGCSLQGDKILITKDLAKTVDFVKNNFGFNFLKEIIAVDNKENGIELTYHMYSPEDNENVMISTVVKDEAESVSKIFDSAVADEKEIYDMFGVKFIGNDELKRLYMPESWQGNPLKKDYKENDERLNWND